MVVSLQNEPSTKRRRCLIGEERKHSGTDDDDDIENDQQQQNFEEAAEMAVATAHLPPTADAAAAAPSKPVCTIFIGGLHPRIVEAHIEKMCSPYGSIQRLHLCERKGYAFCQFSAPSEAEAAMQALDGRGLLGRRLMVRPAHNDTNQNNNSGGGLSGGMQGTSNTNNNNNNPDKERERLEARIQAVKRKLDAKQSSNSA